MTIGCQLLALMVTSFQSCPAGNLRSAGKDGQYKLDKLNSSAADIKGVPNAECPLLRLNVDMEAFKIISGLSNVASSFCHACFAVETTGKAGHTKTEP